MKTNIKINTEKKYPLFAETKRSSNNAGKPLSYYTSDSDEVRLSRAAIKQRAKQRKKQVRRQKIGIAGAALMLLGAVSGGLINKNNTETPPITSEPIIETKQPSSEAETLHIDYEDYTIEPALSAEEILESNLDVKVEYDKLAAAIERFSDELGEDGLSLIKERVNELGNGKVNVLDVLKILWIESKGRIYEEDGSGEILTSYTGEAFGPFQLTPDTVDYLNNYYGLTGTEKELDVMNPYDNLDACIYNLKFLYDKREQEINSGINLPTGDDILEAVAWSYHDGAWASMITDYGQDYIDQYRDLSILDDYPEVVESLLG